MAAHERFASARLTPLLLVLPFVTACGGPSPNHVADADVGFPDAAVGKWDVLPLPPQVVRQPGHVMKDPLLVAVFFANEDPALLPKLEAFYRGLGASSFWRSGEEYGVGPATAQIVVLPANAPSTIDDTTDAQGDNTALESWLLAQLSSKALPGPGPDVTYLLNFPATTTVTASGKQCTDFDGYHTDLSGPDGVDVSYAVIPHCVDPDSTFLETFTVTVSHEALEAATDPFPDYSPGWAQVDDPHLYFDEADTGSEIADLCENDPEANHTFDDFPFEVQRVWSNASARAGHDPCVPEIPGKAFFNAVPELPDTGPFSYLMASTQVGSVEIPVGGSRTVYVDLYSDGDVPDWDVTVADYNAFFTGDPSQALLDVEMPITRGNAGDRLPVRLTVRAAGDPASNAEVANTELFVVYSSQGPSTSAPAHLWFGVVSN